MSLILLALLVPLLALVAPAAQIDAQDDPGWSIADQQAAAASLLAQLERIDGPVDITTLTIDPALGPPPWTSTVPGRDPSTVDAWVELASRLGGVPTAAPAARSRALAAELTVVDIEQEGGLFLNDTPATGQFVNGFGSGGGQQSLARISGALSSAPVPPPPDPDCPSTEPDGAIGAANLVPSSPLDVPFVLCGGVVGDGDFGSTSGDADFFAFGQVERGALLTIDVGTLDEDADFAATTAIYTSGGVLLGSLDDRDNSTDSTLTVVAPAEGEYFAAVTGLSALPVDPFDSSSGPGVTTTGAYLAIIGIEPAQPGPCISTEPDDAISAATPVSLAGDMIQPCSGILGDGAFGESTGDFDFFAFDAAADSAIVVDVLVPQAQPATPTTLAIYDSAGNLVASTDDDGVDPNHYLVAKIDEPGTYYALVTSPGVLPADPFDAGSGTVAGPATPYTVYLFAEPIADDGAGPGPAPIGAAAQARATAISTDLFANLELLSVPCVPSEDDGSILTANPTMMRNGSSVRCSARIGDGPFNQSSGDIDVYEIAAVRGQSIVADVDARALGSLDSFVTVFDANGLVVAANDDFDGSDSRVEWPVTADGTYFVAVSARGSGLGDPFDSASGNGYQSLGPYELTLGRVETTGPDLDVFLVDLEIGDALSAGFTTTGDVTILDPNGVVVLATSGSLASRYPSASPLGYTGNVGGDHVSEIAGAHAVMLSDGPTSYDGELRVRRAGLSDAPGDDVQIIFLDFDGASYNSEIFDPFASPGAGVTRTMSPLSAWLSRWELAPGDEDAVIDAVIEAFEENLLDDLQEVGGNGNRDATGIGGELDLEILNSRDHPDPWGQPNVSRIIIGGSRAEAGISDIMGIAQSIDPGNLVREETALVLLDILSNPVGNPRLSLNDFLVAAPLTKSDLVGRGIAVIASHEAGHLLGNWHTDPGNGTASIMDTGSDLIAGLGLGIDLTLGTADDTDTDFVADVFTPREGLRGLQNTRVRTAQALSTGQTNVPIEPEPTGPADGIYHLRNEETGRLLSGSSATRMVSSALPSSVDRWQLGTSADGSRTLRNVDTGSYLAGQGTWQVGQVTALSPDTAWQVVPAEGNGFYLNNPVRERFLSARRVRIHLSTAETAAQRWTFEPIAGRDDPTPFVGEQILFQSDLTDQWMGSHPQRNVDQSVDASQRSIWQVLDAGGGYVYLQNVASGRFADARNRARDGDVRTSADPRADDRWLLIESDGFVTIQNGLTSGFVAALQADADFNVVEGPIESVATQWQIVLSIDLAAPPG